MRQERRPDIEKLTRLVSRLRAPDGCPWDREQTLQDLRAYVLEEAHEVAQAIDRRDWAELLAELGDLLFQVVFVSRLAEEEGHFDLAHVIDGIEDKMIRRHPHVFAEEKRDTTAAVVEAWEKGKLRRRGSLLAGLPPSLPALLTCYRMTQKAAGVGFDWSTVDEVLEKVDEELQELREALTQASAPESPARGDRRRVREELGDLLFTLGNLARHLKIDPEGAVSETNLKYQRRFQWMEEALKRQGRSLAEASLEEMDALWEEAKEALRPHP